MSTTKEYLSYVLEQLGGLDGITYRSMMGEYIIYYKEKIIAYICDDRLLAKITPSALADIPNARFEKPYDGAKDMLLVEDIDDREFLCKLFDDMYDELPLPKKKNKSSN